MNSRIEKLRQSLFNIKPQICPERARYFTKSMRETEGEYIGLRRAKAFKYVLENISIYINNDELIVGNQASKPKASPIYPEYSYKWIENEFNGEPYYFNKRPGDNFEYSEEVKNEILEILDYWKDKTLYESFRKSLPYEINTAWNIGAIDDTWVSSAGFGNVVVDYGEIINKGLEHYIEKAKRKLQEINPTEPDSYKKIWNLESMIISGNAVISYSERFSKECERLIEIESNPKRKKELSIIAENCKNVPRKPAKTFFEGVQSVWMILLALHLETNGHAISLGRFDQYLYDLYKKDSENGLKKEEALEIVEAFFIKINELNKLRSWPDTAFFLGYQMFVNLALGGQTKSGEDAVNDLSYIVLDACSNLKLFTPSISIKCFSKTSNEFLDSALIALNNHKGGQPCFYNDDAFIKTLRQMGISENDLYNWVPDGCIEATIPGKWDFAAKGPWLNIAKILEITLNNGKDPKSGVTLFKGKGDVTSFKDTGKLIDAFKYQLYKYMSLQVWCENINDYFHREKDLNLFRSLIIDDCIERGLDLIEGGSVYSADGGPTTGAITSADAIAAIEYIVFDKKLLSLKEIKYALDTNFEDNTTNPKGEEIRQLLLNKAPRFGNDNDKVDKIAYEILDFLGSTYRNDFKNSRYGKGPVPSCYSLSQSPVTANIAFGEFVGALPNGRKSGEALNNGMSPCNGSEKNGPTAVINSVGKMPSIWFQKGAILNMRLNKDSLISKEGRLRAIGLIKTLFKKHGQHIQFNIIDNKVLKEAQQYPEKYEDLMIRVSGYSTLFTPLAKSVQNDLIKREEFYI